MTCRLLLPLLPAPGTCPRASSALVTGVLWDTMAPSALTSQLPHISISVASKLCPRFQRSREHAAAGSGHAEPLQGHPQGQTRLGARGSGTKNLREYKVPEKSTACEFCESSGENCSAKDRRQTVRVCIREGESKMEGGTQGRERPRGPWGGQENQAAWYPRASAPCSHHIILPASFPALQCLPSHRLHDDCSSTHGHSSTSTRNSGLHALNTLETQHVQYGPCHYLENLTFLWSVVA